MSARNALPDLNPRQREAVLYDDGGALILAGAGTGKTRVLTGKIIHLIAEQQIPPAQILAVTFTNKAAREMRERIHAALPLPPRSLMLGTFHSICHRILRIHAAAAGRDRNFQILDAQDQTVFIRRLLRAHDVSDKEFPPADVRSYISAAKERGYRAASAPRYDDRASKMAEIYQWYEETSLQENKADFAELMLGVIELWQANDALRAHYARRFRYILADEFQDTSRQQFQWLKMLDSGDNRFFAVGDDDQSIYAFRGAEPKIMQEFQSALRAERLIRLEENYRSVGNILTAANHLIRGNSSRLGKALTTSAGAGEAVEILPADSDEMEAKTIAQLLWHAIEREQRSPADTAVLYRTNVQARQIERELMNYGVPYRIYGGLRFYDRMEIKHALAYLRLLTADDNDSLMRVINMPPRGIGDKTVQTLTAEGQPFQALAGSAHKGVKNFHALLTDLRRGYAEKTFLDTVRDVLQYSGLLEYYESRGEEERAEHLRELVSAAAQFEQHYGEEDDEAGDALTAFLSAAALQSGGEEEEAAGEAAVSLMTIHAAKGLEFEQVLVAGMEEGLFPHQRSLESGKAEDIEEERRLMYVAITRARRKLTLHFARRRMLYGAPSYNPFSRFLNELPPQCLADMDWQAAPAAQQHSLAADGFAPRAAHAHRRHRSGPAAKADGAPPDLAAASRHAGSGGYRIGDPVRHPRYGKGVVMARSGGGEDLRIEVFFKQHGKKEFKAALAKLEKL